MLGHDGVSAAETKTNGTLPPADMGVAAPTPLAKTVEPTEAATPSGTVTPEAAPPAPPAAATPHFDRAVQRIASAMRRGLRGLADLRPLTLKSRVARISIGVSLLILGAAIYTPQVLYTISTEAVINARIVTVSSPIDGRIVSAPPREGAVVAANAPLLAIENETVDRGRVEELQAQRAKAENELASLTRFASSLDEQIKTLNAQMATYQKATIARLQMVLGESRADAKSLRAAAREAQSDFARKSQLHATGFVSHAVIGKAEQIATSLRATVERADLAAKRVSQELGAARQGVYVGQDHNDVPYSQQHRDELRMRHAEVEVQRAVLAAHVQQLNQQIAVESSRLSHLASAEIRSPVSGVVWRPLVVAGSPVARDAELLTLIDCSSLYVTATFSGRRFDDLQYGAPALVHVLGSNAEYTGTVVDVRAMQRAAIEERFGAPLPTLGARQVLAIIQIDEAAVLASEKYCNVGRKVEVRFTDLGSRAHAAPRADHGQ